MKKSILLLSFIPLISLSSCFYEIPEPKDMLKRIIEEQKYDEVYSFTYSSAYLNSLAPKEWQKGYYANIYATYGKIDDEDVFYIYGDDEMGEIFTPFTYEWPLKHTYDECLETYKKHIGYKEFKKTLDDNVTFVTNLDEIDKIFSDKDVKPDNDFIIKCDSSHYLCEINGELNYIYTNLK